jgi:hypothetical protein
MLNLLYTGTISRSNDSWSLQPERYGFYIYKYPTWQSSIRFWFSLPIEYTYRNIHPRFYIVKLWRNFNEKVRTRKDKEEGKN